MKDTSKLPEWPEKPAGSAYRGHSQWQDYFHCQSEAALARMEALVDYVDHLHTCRGSSSPCPCGLDELLAACERKESGR